MDKDALINELRVIVEDYLKSKSLDLVDILYRRQGREAVFKILVDKPEGGISIGDCAYINKEVSIILDEKDILKESYLLEVSSPGLDRPLKTKSDFSRCINREVRLFFNEHVNGKFEIEGIINNVGENSVFIDAQGQIIEIEFSKIAKAKQIV